MSLKTEFGNRNEFEIIALERMLQRGVSENLIRAFGWAYLNKISDRLIAVSEAHAAGKIGEFDMTESMKHAEKAVAKLAEYGYSARIRRDGTMGGDTFMTSDYVVKEKGALLIDPPSGTTH